MSTCRKIKESDVSNALETRSAAWTASDNNRLQLQFIYLLHAVIVVSQIPALRLWPSTRDAIVYIIIVAVLELITSNVWQPRTTSFCSPCTLSKHSDRRQTHLPLCALYCERYSHWLDCWCNCCIRHELYWSKSMAPSTTLNLLCVGRLAWFA